MIILHIGLPKTGTTFLQYRIYKESYGDRFFHWKTSKNARRLGHMARKDGVFKELANWFEKLDDGRPSMITNENINSHGEGFWGGSGPSSLNVGKYLRELRDAASVASPTFKIIFGVRRQDQMLASRYSQFASARAGCSQKDFEQRVSFILESASRLPGHRWLYYDMVKSDLEECFGEENVFIFSQEALLSDPEFVVERMGDFCSLDFSSALKEARNRGNFKSVNRKSMGKDRWKLNDVEDGFFLPEELKNSILKHFHKSNELFTKNMDSALADFAGTDV